MGQRQNYIIKKINVNDRSELLREEDNYIQSNRDNEMCLNMRSSARNNLKDNTKVLENEANNKQPYNKYSNAKIYKIYSDEGYFYYGSTIQNIHRRFVKHQQLSIKEKQKQSKLYNYFNTKGWDTAKIEVISEHNFSSKKELLTEENKYIHQLFDNPFCLNGQHAILNEEKRKYHNKEYRKLNKDKIDAYKKEHYDRDKKKIYNKIYGELNKEKKQKKQKEYYNENREQILLKAKIYDANNKEKRKERDMKYYYSHKEQRQTYNKMYREMNIEKLSEKQKQYVEQNKENIKEKYSEKFNCVCGGKYTKGHLQTHLKTKKHINFIKSQE